MMDLEREQSGGFRRLSRRGLWLVVGLVVGVGAGLLLGWVVWPLEFSDADPAVLEEEIQRDYALMIAGGYWLDDNLARARQRLRSLDKDDLDGWLLAVTVDHILQDGDPLEARQLVKLASDLGIESPIMAPYLPAESPEAGAGGAGP
ncbi:MAG: hypothetical protein R3300_05510 [Candidatus Promineifilaceae bacterium]|nr:hypothetical protein [Candidatus Promineifilaceae bacterium]